MIIFYILFIFSLLSDYWLQKNTNFITICFLKVDLVRQLTYSIQQYAKYLFGILMLFLFAKERPETRS